MGSFEKLGILVIVVIIVMILAVAIYQWGGTADGTAAGEAATLSATAPLLDVPYIERHEREQAAERSAASATPANDGEWPGGVPKLHTVQPGDRVWVLAVKRWRLREAFVAAIAAANPRVDPKDLKAGTVLQIPDPAAYRPGDAAAPLQAEAGRTARYEVQVGDTLETIARDHLGAKKHWRKILVCNPGLNPRRLMPGQEILLPLK